MSWRGVYRSIFSSLLDDPDFQRLTSPARHVLLTVRLCSQAGPAAIFRYYPEVLCAQTRYTAKVLEQSLQELERGGWILREGVILWVKNGLRYDPAIKLADQKHRKAVEKAVASLPKLGIVLRFCDYYKITRPFEGPSEALERPFDDPSLPIPIPRPIPRPNLSRPFKGPALTSGNGSDPVKGKNLLTWETYLIDFPPHEKSLLHRTNEAIASTRRGGRVAASVLDGLARELSSHAPLVVIRACQVYLDGGHAVEGRNERYFLGIVRGEAKRDGRSSGSSPVLALSPGAALIRQAAARELAEDSG